LILLQLIPEEGKEPLIIQALATHHLDAVTSPVALPVPGKDTLHVALLIPERSRARSDQLIQCGALMSWGAKVALT